MGRDSLMVCKSNFQISSWRLLLGRGLYVTGFFNSDILNLPMVRETEGLTLLLL